MKTSRGARSVSKGGCDSGRRGRPHAFRCSFSPITREDRIAWSEVMSSWDAITVSERGGGRGEGEGGCQTKRHERCLENRSSRLPSAPGKSALGTGGGVQPKDTSLTTTTNLQRVASPSKEGAQPPISCCQYRPAQPDLCIDERCTDSHMSQGPTRGLNLALSVQADSMPDIC